MPWKLRARHDMNIKQKRFRMEKVNDAEILLTSTYYLLFVLTLCCSEQLHRMKYNRTLDHFTCSCIKRQQGRNGRFDRFQRFSNYLSKPGIHDELLCAHQNNKSSDQCTIEVTNNGHDSSAHDASAKNTRGLDSVLHHSCSGSKLKKHKKQLKTYIHGRMSLGVVRRKLTCIV